jgi:ribosomal protein S18 acetylase RimI-like enzyme
MKSSDYKYAVALWSSMPGIKVQESGEDSAEGLSAFLDRNQGLSFTAKHNGRLIGTVMCGHDGRRGFIYHLAVAPEFRRMGIAKRLLELPLDGLRKAGIAKCGLFVLKDNDVGGAFYKAVGWQENDTTNVFSKML